MEAVMMNLIDESIEASVEESCGDSNGVEFDSRGIEE